MADFTPGTKLNNNATVLFHQGEVVLAYTSSNSFQPYVTWNVDTNGNCSSGHYFSHQQDAMIDYLSRAGFDLKDVLKDVGKQLDFLIAPLPDLQARRNKR